MVCGMFTNVEKVLENEGEKIALPLFQTMLHPVYVAQREEYKLWALAPQGPPL